MFDAKKVRFLLAGIALVALLLNFFLLQPSIGVTSRVNAGTSSEKGGVPSNIPDSGYTFNDTKGKVLGNPERAIEQMKQFYEKMVIYKKRHGKFPNNNTRPYLTDDMWKHNKEYGLKTPKDAVLAFRNPDAKYSDVYRHFPQPEAVDVYLQFGVRPDGKPNGSPKPAGTRDVLAFCEIYFYRNETSYTDKPPTANPVGFYLVLWEDGQVEKVPHDRVRYTYPQTGPTNVCFPGQAGVPEKTYTYEQEKWRVLPISPNGTNPNVVLPDGTHPKSGV